MFKIFEIFLSSLHLYFKIKFGFRRSKYPWRISFILCQKILFVTNFLFFRISNTTTISQRNPLKKTSNSKRKKKKLKCKEFPSFDGEVEACCLPRKKRNRKRDFLFERFYSGRGWYIFLRGPVLPCKPNKEARTSGHTRRRGERWTRRVGAAFVPSSSPRRFVFERALRTIKGFRWSSSWKNGFHELLASPQTNGAGIFSFITGPERFTSRKPLLIGRSRFFFFLLDQQTCWRVAAFAPVPPFSYSV